jgi:hypothetical protein
MMRSARRQAAELALDLATKLVRDARVAADAAKQFERDGKRNDAFRALGRSEGLLEASAWARVLGREL